MNPNASPAAPIISRTCALVIALLLVVAFSTTAQQFTRKDDLTMIKGYTFVMSPPSIDSIPVEDPVTEEITIHVVKRDPAPEKLNGLYIPHCDLDTPAVFTGKEKSLTKYLLAHLSPELSKLEDGEYQLSVGPYIDVKGKVGGFYYNGIRTYKDRDKVDSTIEQKVYDKLCSLLVSLPAFIPAQLNGESVPSIYYDDLEFDGNFKIKGHKLYDQYKYRERGPKIWMDSTTTGNFKFMLGKSGSTRITYDQLLADPAFYLSIDNVHYDVVGFNIYILPYRRDPLRWAIVKTNRIPGEQLEYLRKLKATNNPKTRIYIEGVRVVGPDQKERKLNMEPMYICTP